MKVLINNKFGGFRIKKDAIKKVLGDNHGVVFDDDLRVNADLIAMKENGEEVEGSTCCDLIVVEVPEDATDWMVTEYDGLETLYAVVDGKIVCCG